MRETIGNRYEFDRASGIIGRGGMGTVYRGIDTTTGNVVAIKQLAPDLLEHHPDFIARFIRESDVLRGLNHPNIIPLYDTISDVELGYYLVMEYIGGGSLWDELQGNRQLPISRTLSIAQDLSSALSLVHEKGIIHRDIKPANVLIADDKSLRLSDFGVIYLQDGTRITETEAIVGTLDYLSPETLNGQPTSVSADIWALGVMLFEMLAGKRPFPSDTPSVLITAILTKPPLDLRVLRPDVSDTLVRLIEWMLVKEPEIRVANMQIVSQIIQEIISGQENISTVIPNTRMANMKCIGSLPKLFIDDLFHDRTNEQSYITNALTNKKPFIGVYGRGGIGKTALVCKVMGDFEKHATPNGVAYLRVNSTPLLNSTILLETLYGFLPAEHDAHSMLKNPDISIAEKTRTLLGALGGGHYVVYLDNTESLQDPVTHTFTDEGMSQFLDTLLETQSNSAISIVATSRYPLPFPNILKPYEIAVRLDEGLPQADALAFLREMDTHGVLPEEDEQLVQWSQKVGGFPRGLEALVGYLKGGDTRHIDDLLDDPTLFEGEILSNVVHQIHNALPPDFRRVMAGVAVIGQNTTRAELDYLLSPYIDTAHIRIILERLVEGRFLIYNRQIRTYSLHPIDRDYALSSTPRGSSDDAETAFTRYILNDRMATYYRNKRKPKAQWNSLADVAEVLREFEYLYAKEDYHLAIETLLEIDKTYIQAWGNMALMYDLYKRLVGKLTIPMWIATCSVYIGTLAFFRGEIDYALEQFQIAIQNTRLIGDKAQESQLLGDMAIILSNVGRIDEALSYYEQSLSLAHEMQDNNVQAIQLGNIGTLYMRDLGQIEKAITYFEQAMTILLTGINPQILAYTHYYLGSAYLMLGQVEPAKHELQTALVITQTVKDRLLGLYVIGQQAMAQKILGQLDEAINRYTAIMDVCHELGDIIELINTLIDLAQVHFLKHQFDIAITYLDEASTIVHDKNLARISQHIMTTKALVLWVKGEYEPAYALSIKAKQYDVKTYTPIVIVYHACIAWCLGKADEAKSDFENGLEAVGALIALSPKVYHLHYSHALALVGLWIAKDDATYYQQALDAYQTAIKIGDAKGILLEKYQLLKALLACTDKDGTALLGLLA